MNNDYKYHNIPLTPKIAAELVCELFMDKGNKKNVDIREQVNQEHISKGGLPPISSLRSVLNKSAVYLRRNGNLTLPTKNYWNVHTPLPDKNNDAPIIVGEGSGCVYVYYYPSYKTNAKSDKSPVWKCKIGRTDGDPYDRVSQQIDNKTGVPEEPSIGLIIKTNDSVDVESNIHSVLKAKKRQVDKAPGKEWYLTSPQEVKRIYNALYNT